MDLSYARVLNMRSKDGMWAGDGEGKEESGIFCAPGRMVIPLLRWGRPGREENRFGGEGAAGLESSVLVRLRCRISMG